MARIDILNKPTFPAIELDMILCIVCTLSLSFGWRNLIQDSTRSHACARELTVLLGTEIDGIMEAIVLRSGRPLEKVSSHFVLEPEVHEKQDTSFRLTFGVAMFSVCDITICTLQIPPIITAQLLEGLNYSQLKPLATHWFERH
ncbi:hypothetical protein BDN71DRAFT_1435927 [Pleurotus eryngii]|uniref:Uncharacterized protein n=1 Tax=Pleurotus eryngii TaxID=5323 RepID=A0A9P5ZIJ9_PLEER|nr:hypothetical protein BDN71DRAFT_1435927 [Pleurotus eryngii]